MIVTYAGNGEFMTVQKALKVGMVISARQWYGETQRLERLHGPPEEARPKREAEMGRRASRSSNEGQR